MVTVFASFTVSVKLGGGFVVEKQVSLFSGHSLGKSGTERKTIDSFLEFNLCQ